MAECRDCQSSSTEVQANKDEDKERPHTSVNQPYVVTKKSKASLNVRIESDRRTCSIDGMCQLPDSRIVLCDGGNGALKLLDTSYNVVSHCTLAYSQYNGPYDACCTDDGQLAATLITTVQFVSVSGDKLVETRSFETVHDSYSIAYLNERLYVTSIEDEIVVYVYNTLGTLLRRILFNDSGEHLSIRQIRINTQFQWLYAACSGKGLVTVDLKRTEQPTFEENDGPEVANPRSALLSVGLNAHILTTFKDPKLPEGAGRLCMDEVGNVFVGAWLPPHNILQVRREGDAKVTQILADADGMKAEFMCFDKVHNKLLVSSCLSDSLSVLELAST